MSSPPKRWRVALAAVLLLPAFASPADLAHQDWTPLDAAVRAQIAAGQLPGAVLVFGDADHVWLRRAWGRRATVLTAIVAALLGAVIGAVATLLSALK